jgi:hypothetical protein
MERYIIQLIEDLQARHKPESDPLPFFLGDDDDSDDLFGDVERYLSGGHERRIGDVLDLIPEQFPPVDQLSADHLSRVVQAYHHLLFTWNICTDIPDNLSLTTAYPLLVGTLDREVYLAEEGFVTIEFCTYDTHTCPYAEVCRCDQEYEAMKNSTQHEGDNDMPF